MKTNRVDHGGPLQRRELIAVLTYVNRTARAQRCVDANFGNAEAYLDRIAAAAGMQ